MEGLNYIPVGYRIIFELKGYLSDFSIALFVGYEFQAVDPLNTGWIFAFMKLGELARLQF